MWGKEQVLADVVWVIRSFRPDVIVTRFPPTGEGGHGNHTASAILAEEAFAAAADAARFPEQLDVGPNLAGEAALVERFPLRRRRPAARDGGHDRRGPRRIQRAPRPLVHGDRRAEPHDAQEPGLRLGRAPRDVAQRLQAPPRRRAKGGSLRGDRPHVGTLRRRGKGRREDSSKGGRGFRDDAATRSRARGRVTASGSFRALRRSPSPVQESNLPLLPDPLLSAKRAEVADTIRACLGLWTEAVAAEPSAAPGTEVKVTTMILNRSSVPVTLESVALTHAAAPLPGGALAANEPLRQTATLTLPQDAAYTQPYWLREPPEKARYAVADPTLVGRPENPPPLVARFAVSVAGASIPFETAVVFRRTDPVKGEVYRPFGIVPPVTANLDEKVYRLRKRHSQGRARHARRGRGERLRHAPPEDARGLRRHAGRGAVRARGERRGEGRFLHRDPARGTRLRDDRRRDDRGRQDRIARSRARGLPAHPAPDALPARRGPRPSDRREGAARPGRLRHGLRRHGPRRAPAARLRRHAPLRRRARDRRPLALLRDRDRDPRVQHAPAPEAGRADV